MHPDEWKLREIMVELNIAVPAFLVMAVVAFSPLLAFVNIILPVAGDAVGFYLVLIKVAFVTIIAACLFMFTEQREVGYLAMIELLLLP